MDLDYGDVPGAGTVTGVGTVRGNLVMIIASDGSLKGGTSYPITVTKSLRAQEVAMENRIPCLYVVDSGGAFLPLQSEIFPDVKHGGRSFRNQVSSNSCNQNTVIWLSLATKNCIRHYIKSKIGICRSKTC